MEKKELNAIFEGAEKAVSEIEKVIKEHEGMNTVVVNPDSWVGKSLLIQTRRLIDLSRDMNSLASSINRLERKLDQLSNDSK